MTKCSKNVRVFSDEIYEDIIFDGNEHLSISSIPGMEKITVLTTGFSKGLAWTGGRLGYSVLPSKEEVDMFTKYNINYFACVAPFI